MQLSSVDQYGVDFDVLIQYSALQNKQSIFIFGHVAVSHAH